MRFPSSFVITTGMATAHSSKRLPCLQDRQGLGTEKGPRLLRVFLLAVANDICGGDICGGGGVCMLYT